MVFFVLLLHHGHSHFHHHHSHLHLFFFKHLTRRKMSSSEATSPVRYSKYFVRFQNKLSLFGTLQSMLLLFFCFFLVLYAFLLFVLCSFIFTTNNNTCTHLTACFSPIIIINLKNSKFCDKKQHSFCKTSLLLFKASNGW